MTGMALARSIPVTPWSSTGSRWRTGPLPLAVLLVALVGFGTGEAALIAAALGNSPWTVFAEGIALRTPLSVGIATLVISVVILLVWMPLGERLGIGTLANAVVIAVAIDVALVWLPRPAAFTAQLAQAVAGTLLVALCGALYLTTNLGPGPRDGLMTGLHRRFDQPIARVRIGLELGALAAGFGLGGTVGVGTVIFALGVGPALAWWLALLPRAAATAAE